MDVLGVLCSNTAGLESFLAAAVQSSAYGLDEMSIDQQESGERGER